MEPKRILAVLSVVTGLLSVTSVLAGPFSSPMDMFPKLNKVELNGNDIVFNSGYKINKGQWSGWVAPTRNLNEREPRENKQPACKLSNEVKSILTDNWYGIDVYLCGESVVWAGREGYCGEGLNEKTTLVQLDPKTKKATGFGHQVPECQAITAAAETSNEVWFALAFPGEWGKSSGLGFLIQDRKNGKWRVQKIETLTSQLVRGMAYDSVRGNLWITTRGGIDRLNVKSGKWEHRYFSPVVDKSGNRTITLSETRPSWSDFWVSYHLNTYPISDHTGFRKTWSRVPGLDDSDRPISSGQMPYRHDSLTTYYIQALKKIDNDRQFIRLLNTIADDPEQPEAIKVMLKEFQKSLDQFRSAKRNAIVKWWDRYDIKGLELEERKHFLALLEESGVSQTHARELCEFLGREGKTDYQALLMQKIKKEEISKIAIETIIKVCVVDRLSEDQNARKRQNLYSTGKKVKSPVHGMHNLVSHLLISGDYRYIQDTCMKLGLYARSPESWANIRGIIIANERLKQGMTTIEDGMHCRVIDSSRSSLICRTAAKEILNDGINVRMLLMALPHHPELVAPGLDILNELWGVNHKTVKQWEAWWETLPPNYKEKPFTRLSWDLGQGRGDRKLCR